MKIIVKGYICNVEWYEPDNEWLITCPKFPGFSILSKSIESGYEQSKIVIDMFIADMKSENETIPTKESSKNVTNKQVSEIIDILENEYEWDCKDRKTYLCNQCKGEIINIKDKGYMYCPYCGNEILENGFYMDDSIYQLRNAINTVIGD